MAPTLAESTTPYGQQPGSYRGVILQLLTLTSDVDKTRAYLDIFTAVGLFFHK